MLKMNPVYDYLRPSQDDYYQASVATMDASFETAARRCFTVSELIHLLSPDTTPLSVSSAPPSTPPLSGALYLYNRRQTRKYKDDGHEWVRKQPTISRRVREDNVKLRLHGQFRVAAWYARSATAKTMRRRSYYLLCPTNSKPKNELVLVHYLEKDDPPMLGVTGAKKGNTKTAKKKNDVDLNNATHSKSSPLSSGQHPAPWCRPSAAGTSTANLTCHENSPRKCGSKESVLEHSVVDGTLRASFLADSDNSDYTEQNQMNGFVELMATLIDERWKDIENFKKNTYYEEAAMDRKRDRAEMEAYNKEAYDKSRSKEKQKAIETTSPIFGDNSIEMNDFCRLLGSDALSPARTQKSHDIQPTVALGNDNRRITGLDASEATSILGPKERDLSGKLLRSDTSSQPNRQSNSDVELKGYSHHMVPGNARAFSWHRLPPKNNQIIPRLGKISERNLEKNKNEEAPKKLTVFGRSIFGVD